jgi:hypothetical protein
MGVAEASITLDREDEAIYQRFERPIHASTIAVVAGIVTGPCSELS